MDTLKGVKVVEVAMFYPGPFCARILSLLGAEVIKIEPPQGDPGRAFSAAFAAFNYGKKIMKLNLKNKEELNKFYEIVEDADIIIEGFRPGVARRLKIDYEIIKEINPSIIYCSISAFGQNSKLKDWPAHDLNILGLAGVVEASCRGNFIDPNVQLADFSSAVYATILILSALYDRTKTGKGRYIDVSMFHSAIFSIPLHSSSLINEGIILPVFSRNPVYDVYNTKDGKVTIGIITEEKFWKGLCRALDLSYDLPLFETFSRYDEIKNRIQEKIRDMTTKEVVKLLRNVDVPVFPVLSLKDYEKIEEFIGEKLVEEVEVDGKKVKIVKPPFG